MKTIYLYHLTQNGRVRYVGVTTNLVIRKRRHKRERPPHTFEIIDTFTDKEEAGIAEQYHIAGHKTFIDGWNKSIGGEKLLTGDKHPSWIDGLSLDKKAYDKEHYQKNRKRILKRKKKHSQIPEVRARKRTYDEEYHAKPEVIARTQTPEAKAKKKEYTQRPEVKARRKAYEQTPKYRARKRELDRIRYHRKKQ